MSNECTYPKPWTWKIVDYDIVFYDNHGVPIFSDIWCESAREKAADMVLELVNMRAEP